MITNIEYFKSYTRGSQTSLHNDPILTTKMTTAPQEGASKPEPAQARPPQVGEAKAKAQGLRAQAGGL